MYSFNNHVSFKGFELNVFFQGSYGNDILNATRIELEGMTDPRNQFTSVLNRWRQPGDITNIPRASWGSTDNSRISSRFVEDGSYLRVKSLTLGYNFPVNWISSMGLSTLKLYVTGENLFTWTNYSGYDPEVNTFGGTTVQRGVDYGTYPQTRNIIFGVNVSL